MHNPKVESYVLFGGRNCGLIPGTQPLRDCSQEVKGEARIYRTFCNKYQVVGTSKDYCYLKKIRYLKLKNLALFYVWEDARVWAY